MATIRRIDDRLSVGPQIQPEDMAEIAAAGFRGVVNNRPDDEEPGQPSGDAIRAAAEAAGLSYAAIPITHAGFSHPQIAAMRDAMAAVDGPVFAFCRSGTRSCNLWALTAASMGDAPDTIQGKAAGAGYDLTGLRPLLDQLAGQA